MESRTKKTLLNARVNLFFYIITLALSFFSRKIFLNILGADFVGLTGTLQNLLSLLNIVELGIGTTVGYVLYRPLFECNQHKINEIISVFGYLYRWVGKIIFIAGVILSLFLPLIFPDTRFNLLIIYLIYYAFLASSLIGYFINYRQTLLSADQKNYVVTAYFQTGNIIKVIIQMISAYYTRNYYLWITIEFIFGIIYAFILNWKINQVYPWLNSEIRIGRLLLKKYPEIIRLTKQVFIHKIAAVIQFQATPFLIYAFVSLQTVAFYGNYTIITDKLKMLLANSLDSTTAGVGNLIAEGNTKNILKTYWELIAIRFFFIGIITFSLYNLLPQFIGLWLGEDYILSTNVLICVLLIFSLNVIRGVTDQFINGYGLFHDIWAPALETFIFLVAALLGGYLWQLEGVLLGSIISLITIVYIWKPYFLFKKGFKLPIRIYWEGFTKFCCISATSFCLYETFIKQLFELPTYSTWGVFIIHSLFVGISFTILQFSLLYISSKGMRNIVRRFI